MGSAPTQRRGHVGSGLRAQEPGLSCTQPEQAPTGHRSLCAASRHTPRQIPSPLCFPPLAPRTAQADGLPCPSSRTVCDTPPVRPTGRCPQEGPGDETKWAGLRALRNLGWGMVPLVTSPSKGPSFSPLLAHRGLSMSHSKWWLTASQGASAGHSPALWEHLDR